MLSHPNPYDFEIYRFKIGPFFETQCSLLYIIASMAAPDDHPFSSVPAAKIKRLTLDLHRLTPARAGSNDICHTAYPPVIRLITK